MRCSGGPSGQVHQPPREVVYALFGRAESASFDRDPAPANLTNGTESSLAPSRNRLNLLPVPPLSSRVAFCVSPICPTTPSTASADMKQAFGAKPDRSFLLSISWIAANHGIGGAVSVLAVAKTC